MWENVNGEWIFMDKEMGADEYERSVVESNRVRISGGACADAGRGLTAGGVAVGVAGGLMAAKAAPRVGGWLLWMALIAIVLMVIM